MKNLLTTALILAMTATIPQVKAQPRQDEYLGLPGDNLNLYAVMKLFQESPTLESFERQLNDENSRINNLDLNGDNYIDYIRVIDYVDGTVHNIVLRVAISRNDNQDVAVFNVQRFRNGDVQIQLIGDEALYGRNYIIEPIYDAQYAGGTANPGYSGYNGTVTVVRTTGFEIAAWPVVRFIFDPGYVVWQSSWYWGYWPTYWHPWRPYYWHYYYGYHYHWYHDYYRFYHRCDHYRYDRWNDFYTSNRHSYSPYVSHRINEGHYRGTYSHPEQRRAGEALYSRSNHDNGNRRNTPAHNNNANGRQLNNPADRRHAESVNNGNVRRSYENAGRTAPAKRQDQNNVTGRRANEGNNTMAPVREKPRELPAERRNVRNNGNKPADRNIVAANPNTTGRPAATVNNRTAANTRTQPAANTRMQPAANTRTQPAARTGNSTGRSHNSDTYSGRRNSGQSQAQKAGRSNETKKSSDSSKQSHRR